MSLAGLKQFNENIKAIQKSKGYKNGNKPEILYRLLNSKYGKGIFGKVHKLEKQPNE